MADDILIENHVFLNRCFQRFDSLLKEVFVCVLLYADGCCLPGFCRAAFGGISKTLISHGRSQPLRQCRRLPGVPAGVCALAFGYLLWTILYVRHSSLHKFCEQGNCKCSVAVFGTVDHAFFDEIISQRSCVLDLNSQLIGNIARSLRLVA